MADKEMTCMSNLTKLDDETRERVLAWAAKKWPAKTQTIASGFVGVSPSAATAAKGG